MAAGAGAIPSSLTKRQAAKPREEFRSLAMLHRPTIVSRMRQSITLHQAIERVADAAEWQEFTSLSGVTKSDLAWNKKLLAPSPHSESSRYERIWSVLSERLREKLRSGGWHAEGVSPAHGIERRRIDRALWDVLEIIPIDLRATGAGMEFVAITISEERAGSETGPADNTADGTPGSLKRELIAFLKDKRDANADPVSRRSLLEEAQQVVSPRIKEYLFDQTVDRMRQTGELPDAFFLKGRPRSKGTGI